MKILRLVENCRECQHRKYYSGGRYECEKTQQIFPEQRVGGPALAPIPNWCPLLDYPSSAIAELEAEVRKLKGQLTKVAK